MSAILECVPNVSEGQNAEVLIALAEAVESVPGVHLLHQDRGESANRTVFTFAGEPEAVVEAAFRLIAAAAEWIDMRKHRGIHPRMGATDVCPLIPISGISMAEAVQLSRTLGERVGRELSIPVYLYEASATRPNRRNLAHIRQGEYEGFVEKIRLPDWQPDFGPTAFQPKSGQTVIGARDFLLAYNVNLATESVEDAKAIAAEVRESGQVIRQGDQKIRVPGRCKSLKAIGWYVEEYGQAQVSMNLTRLADTTLYQAFEAVQEAAVRRGIQTQGSELIGLTPLAAMLAAGRHFYEKAGKPLPFQTDEFVAKAISGLGLAAVVPFDPQEKIIEYRLAWAASRS
jgi:glutamate formiminotransferase/formiminotetrahydrofolate cyclodeaminase